MVGARCGATLTHGDAITNLNANPYPDICANGSTGSYSNAPAYGYSVTDSLANGHTPADANASGHAVAGRYANCNADCNGDSDRYANANGNSYWLTLKV